MSYVDEEKRAYQRKWAQENKDKMNAWKQQLRKRNQAYVDELKNNPCTDCGQVFPPVAMDFDHLRDKVMKLSRLVNGAFSIERIDRELAKCELVCANCHRIRTQERLVGANE